MSEIAVAPASNPGRAAIWMIGAIISFSAMAVAGRAVAVELDTFELMTYRSAVSLILVLAIGGMAGTLGQITRRNLRLHGIRNLAHFTGQNLWFYAITVVPLAQVFALEFTSPLWVMILAALFLGERLTRLKIGVGILGFVGVLIVLQPGSVPLSPGMIAAALAAICFAATAIFTKFLTRTESITCILFYLATIQLAFGLVVCLIDGEMALPSLSVAPWVVLVGIAGLTAHFCMTMALSIAPASVVMPVDFVRLPAIALVGMILYDEPLQLAVFLGAALIFAANYANILDETRRNRARKQL
ncbi:EamA family transporter [Roseobacter sp. HKCCD9010]|uniref:DMT family transporter n=1 Tax=unclassified Roseobacter TaxID=196798 RepID=UPI001492A2CA|nr:MULTISPECIES: DMT family transporter [unclassified Roseobacter]MBF9050315.1 EamA family transporter [Rhodobacterales bacterium HKCCD4356]NNV12558.1 EamA family transporter [Roseobacter sp. HKCCD7357]NNV15977.1 EamA family transporter [Roseobacter sp. HKCCD8768]NNV25437.1 EamA family transporter [Roseobacter sp. HKCCD8192]NNV29694.1 EamA family transporter [Roseobacter sp. HKCCD9061]